VDPSELTTFNPSSVISEDTGYIAAKAATALVTSPIAAAAALAPLYGILAKISLSIIAVVVVIVDLLLIFCVFVMALAYYLYSASVPQVKGKGVSGYSLYF